jgi:hypothetical protein
MASHRRAQPHAKTIPMHLISIAWLYVALMAAVVEATSSQGSVLGALFTFVGYGVLPLSIVLYVLRSRIRRAAQRAAAASADAQGLDPDGGGHASGHAIASEREEP